MKASDKIQQAFWREREREIKPCGVYKNMKECILEASLARQGWQSRLFTILLILTWELRYPQKIGVKRKRGAVLELVLPGREANDFLWEGRICLEDKG